VAFGKVSFKLASYAAPTPSSSMSGISRPMAGATIIRQIPMPEARAGVVAAPAKDKSQEKLATLLEVSKGLTRAVDVDTILAKIVGYAYQTLDVDRVAILLLDDHGDLVPKIARDRRGADAPRTVPQSIARQAIQEKSALLTDNAGEDERFGGDSIVMQQVRSAICAPLIGSEDRVLGVLYVDNPSMAHQFSDDDLEFLVAFAGIAAVAIENSQFAERIRREALVRSNFERYFAPQLAERIADSAEATKLGGEKRAVAVLFSDIRGFTPLSESMTPDEIATLLTEYFTEMVECVFRHGGMLDKFIGDAVMAQWGAPLGNPDDADRALQAAVDMMAALDALNARWREQGRPTLEIGIGLNYGEAFAGNIGSERRLEFTVIGDTVNTASRLCSAAEAGEILLSESMKRALGAPPPLEKRPAMALKGKKGSLHVYRIRTG
jgi:adenylate cyclase